MRHYYLKSQYYDCVKDISTQPIGMALSNIDVTKPLEVTGELLPFVELPLEVRYTCVNGYRPFGYVERKFITLFKNGKTGKKLRQRKVGKRK